MKIKFDRKDKRFNLMVMWTLITIVLVIMVLIIYFGLNRSNRMKAYQTSDLLIKQVEDVIEENKRKEKSLTDSLKENYISKAKAVAYIVDSSPETEYDLAELIRIAKLMSIDEIHLFTEDGEIYSGTVPIYYGFSFDSGEQMAFFKPMLNDKALSMCQDVTPNTAESKPMMYAICWNDSGTRMVQIGIEPRRLIEEMQRNEISEVVANLPTNEGVKIAIADKETGKILGDTTADHIGKTMEDIGITPVRSENGSAHFQVKTDGEVFYCSIDESEDYRIAVAQSKESVNGDIPLTLLYVSVYLLIAASAIGLIVKNMTARRERLIAISERAVAASEAKTSFLSNMSHEIRTPINAILGMNEMILRECGDDSVIGYSENIKTAGNTLLGIVNDILDFSKIEAGKLEIIPVEYDLSSVINDLVNMVRTKVDEKRLRLNLDIDRNTPKYLYGDEIRIKQIVTNILTNAVKYTERGVISFSINYEADTSDKSLIDLIVSVKDTGIGIKPEDMEKLFSKYDRIEEKRNRNVEGTGLGMNITKGLLEMMGSRLEVESTYGFGSTFSFRLKQKVMEWKPLGNYEEAWKSHVSSRSVYHQQFTAPSARVLAVDDNEMNLAVFVNLLKKTELKIDTALSGSECLALAEKNKYDVIFLDHMMPEKDGIETLHELRSRSENPNLQTPVICLTANAVSGAKEEYMDAGFDDYLAKPIDSNRLEELLKYYLPANKVNNTGETEEVFGTNGGIRPSVPDELRPLKEVGIDVEQMILNTGDEKAFLPLLQMFSDTLDDKAGEIDMLFSREEYKDYTIKVHAIKSSLRLIGDDILADRAQELESAAKSKDYDFIKENHGVFMEGLRRLKAPLNSALSGRSGDEIEKTAATSDIIAEAYSELRDAACEMDSDRIDEILDRMASYTIPDGDIDRFNSIRNAAREFDYDAITSLVSM